MDIQFWNPAVEVSHDRQKDIWLVTSNASLKNAISIENQLDTYFPPTNAKLILKKSHNSFPPVWKDS